MICEYKKKGLAPFHFFKISVNKFLIDVNFLFIKIFCYIYDVVI